MNIFFVSLGCDKNLVDSEQMLGLLAADGFRITDEPEEADVIVVNTCSFILDAEEESVNTILEMADYKKNGVCNSLIVTGCLAQRFEKDIHQEIPEVDAVLGTNSYDKIVEAVRVSLGGDFYDKTDTLDTIPNVKTQRILSTPSHYAYLKISEGCAKHCSYCIIPALRGPYRSRPVPEIVKEARELASFGVKELILVAQETTLYGVDLYGEKKLPYLLKMLSMVEGIRWIRLLYCYPEEITDDLIHEIKVNPKVCHYLDMPIQHADDFILKRMGRKTSRSELTGLIAKIRKEIPDIALRTTLISGFPGETEEMHENLLDFVEEMQFDRLGVFPYSREDGTPAASFPDQVPEEVKQERRDAIMQLQQQISLRKNQTLVGKTMEVLLDGYLPEEGVYAGRTYRDTPDVDGIIFVKGPEGLMSGDFVNVRVTGSSEYDLTGELYYESAE